MRRPAAPPSVVRLRPPPPARAGTRLPEIPLEDRLVRVDPPIAEEGPVATRILDHRRVTPGDQHLRVGPRVGDDPAEGVAHEGVPEELEPIRPRLRLVTDAVGRGDIDAVGDRVTALDGAPRLDLGGPVLRLLGRMPADRRRIEEDVGA